MDGNGTPPTRLIPTFSQVVESNDMYLSFTESRAPFGPRETNTMGRQRPDIIKGTLDMLILKTVSLEPMHGWGIQERIQQVSGDLLRVQQGSLYASLHRLTREGWIRSYWRVTEHNRRARYYALTRAGTGQLGVEVDHWRRLAKGVTRVIATT